MLLIVSLDASSGRAKLVRIRKQVQRSGMQLHSPMFDDDTFGTTTMNGEEELFVVVTRHAAVAIIVIGLGV
jgi:hypothetical protein